MKPRFNRYELIALSFDEQGWIIRVQLAVLAYLKHYGKLGLQLVVFWMLSWRWGMRTKSIVWQLHTQAMWPSFKNLRHKIRWARLRIDPRDGQIIPKSYRVRCAHCNVVTTSKYPLSCWLCGEHVYQGKRTSSGKLMLFYRHGSRLFTPDQVRKSEDANRGAGGIDLLQPSRHYDPSKKQWHTNPDYVKHWGDPFAGDTTSH